MKANMKKSKEEQKEKIIYELHHRVHYGIWCSIPIDFSAVIIKVAEKSISK